METTITAEKFLGLEFVDLSDEESFEQISVSLEDVCDVEAEKEKFTNLRKQAAMLLHILEPNAEVRYPLVTRSRHEVRSGYKEAVRRGARLQETEVFNLLFTSNGKLKADGVALMCHGPRGEEWIMLCPDDTVKRIQMEKRKFASVATQLTFEGKMKSEHHNELLENMNTLTIGTRCANSLIHEYGHVLHYRLWAADGIAPQDLLGQFRWFVQIGYVANVWERIDRLLEMPVVEVLYELKESFVEDYRIGLNLTAQKGIFELPNAQCFIGDFKDSALMYEGVNIVKSAVENLKNKKHLNGKNENQVVQLSYQRDTIEVIDEKWAKAQAFGDRLDNIELTPEDIANFEARILAEMAGSGLK